MEPKPLFMLDGRAVYRGDVLHVAPAWHARAGATCKAERPEEEPGRVVVRSLPSGAVPTVPISALSWEPHPDVTDRETIRSQLPSGRRVASEITDRDLFFWRLGRSAER